MEDVEETIDQPRSKRVKYSGMPPVHSILTFKTPPFKNVRHYIHLGQRPENQVSRTKRRGYVFT